MENFGYWFGGALFGALGMIILFSVFLGDVATNGSKAVSLIEECQKTLPRNVECVIVAVPEDDVDNSEVTYHED